MTIITPSEIHKKWLEIPEKKRINEINKAMHSVGGGQPIPHAEAKRRVYEKFKQEKFDLLKKRALKIKQVVQDPVYRDGFDVYPFNSGYFMCIRLKDVNAEDLRVHLLDKYGTGLISIGDKNIRIAFSCLEQEDVKPLFDTIMNGINDLRKG